MGEDDPSKIKIITKAAGAVSQAVGGVVGRVSDVHDVKMLLITRKKIFESMMVIVLL